MEVLDAFNKFEDGCTIESVGDSNKSKPKTISKRDIEMEWIRSDLIKKTNFEDHQNNILKTTIKAKISNYSVGKALSNSGQELQNSPDYNLFNHRSIFGTDWQKMPQQNPIFSSSTDQNYRLQQQSDISQNSITKTVDNQLDQQDNSQSLRRPNQRQNSTPSDFASASLDSTSINGRLHFYLHENQTSTVNSTPAHQWQQTHQERSINYNKMLRRDWQCQQEKPPVNPASAQKERQQRLLEKQRSSTELTNDALITQQLQGIQFPQQPLNSWIGSQPVQFLQQQQVNYSLQQHPPQHQVQFPQSSAGMNRQVIQSWNELQQQQIFRQHMFSDLTTSLNNQFLQYYVNAALNPNSEQQNPISQQFLQPSLNSNSINQLYQSSQEQPPEGETGNAIRSKKTTARTALKKKKKANPNQVKLENKENSNQTSGNGQPTVSNTTLDSPNDSKKSESEQRSGRVIVNLSEIRNQTIEQFAYVNRVRNRGNTLNDFPISTTNEYGGLYQNNYGMLRNWLLAQREHVVRRIAESPNADASLE